MQDSKAQVTAIHLIIGTLQRMSIFGVENRDTLTHKATGVWQALPIDLYCWMHLVSCIISSLTLFCYLQYSAKLLKKPDQCRAVYACSHLFWVDDQDGIKDGERWSSVFPVLLYDQNKCVKGFPFANYTIFKLKYSCFVPRNAWLEFQTEISMPIVIVPSLLIEILKKLYREVRIFCILYIDNDLCPSICRVLLCLKRALRIANAAQQMASATRGSSGPVTLFVEILNKCVLYRSVVKRNVYLALFLICLCEQFSGTCTFSRKEIRKSQVQWSRAWLNWSQPKCRVTTRQQILLLMLSLPAHWDTSSFRNRKVEQWAKNTSLLKCHYELPVWFFSPPFFFSFSQIIHWGSKM